MKDAKRCGNNKLMKDYQNTYYRYIQTCERYDQLVRAYTKLLHSKEKASAENKPVAPPVNSTLVEKNLRHMIKKAYIEKSIIAEQARECLLNHRKRKAERIHFEVDSVTADQWI